jgi:hypothetical protein
MRKRAVVAALCAWALAAAIAASPAPASFGLHDLAVTATNEDASLATQAGSHPFALTTKIAVNTEEIEFEGHPLEVPEEAARDIIAQLPPGVLANPTAVPRCSAADFAAGEESICPASSALGIFDLTFGFGEPSLVHSPIYNLLPPPGKVARLGFRALGFPVTVDAEVNPNPPYNAIANSLNVAQGGFFYRGDLTLWGNPASPAHDAQRGECGGSDKVDFCPVSISERPFTLLPRACTGPLVSEIKARSWEQPEVWLTYSIASEGMTGCSKLPFAPQIDAQLSTEDAESPSGLAFNLDIADPGLENPDGVAVSDLKKAVVTLPEGVTVNPSQAEGLVGCSEKDLEGETADSQPGQGCPEASKIGTVEVETPLLEGEILKGGLFVATPFENKFHSLIALYMTIKDPQLGVSIEVAGKVEPDPKTGQLISTFEGLPQTPFSHFRLHFREGGRSALISPPHCGSYETKAVMTPWANPNTPYITTSAFEVTKGVGGGPCPASGAQPFQPGFEAGSQGNAAGRYSPFEMRLTRRDGDQDLTRFDATLPPGVLAKLAGVDQCPNAQIAKAKAKTGKEELASPSCPSNSKIGRIEAGAGVGSQLTYVPGSLYLAGPFAGAPLSVLGVVPAVAGPFDVGTVVVRQALQLNPRTGEVSADGAHSDPIPHILAGIPLRVRDIQVYVDRSNFTINPTSCDPFATKASIWGGGANPFSSSDDAPVPREARYQAASCASLGFKPKLSLKLKGATNRGAHPELRGTYTPRPGDANLQGVVLRFPHSAFLDQGHIRTICTRVQFAAQGGNGGGCPQGAIYGHVRAFTPLLSQPLEGPAYLRSSSHNLPDLVFALHGIVNLEAVARIDSKNGGIRATFTEAPDAPISKVVVVMQGAKKGLIVNSTNLCASKHHANAQFEAHNGKQSTSRPLMVAQCSKKR